MTDEVSMFEFSQDLADAKKPPLLPIGEYNATVIKAVPGFKEETGNRWLNISYRISPDNYPADYDASFDPEGKVVFYMTKPLKDDARGRYNASELLKAHGLPGGRGLNPNDLIGQSARVRIVHDNYGGEAKEKVASVQVAE